MVTRTRRDASKNARQLAKNIHEGTMWVDHLPYCSRILHMRITYYPARQFLREIRTPNAQTVRKNEAIDTQPCEPPNIGDNLCLTRIRLAVDDTVDLPSLDSENSRTIRLALELLIQEA